MRKYFLPVIVVLILLSCSEMPTRDNPYDLYFDMPEPTDLQVEHISITTKKFSWSYDLDRFDGFFISRQVNGSWTVIDTIAMDVRNITDYDVPVNVNLKYKIVAYADQNFSDEVLSEYIDNTMPTPTDLTVIQTNIHRYELIWEQSHIIGEEGFVVERQIGEGNFEQIALLEADSEGYIDNWETDRRGSNEVIYQIKAYIGDEYSSPAGVASQIFPSSFAPSDLTYEKFAINRIKLEWQDNSEGEEGFKVDKKVGSGDWIVGFDMISDNSIFWIDESAEINQEISYRIRAYYGDFESDIVESGAIDNTFPVPNGFQITKINVSTYDLSWNQDHIIGEEGFILQRKIEDGDYMPLVTLGENSDSYQDVLNTVRDINTVYYRLCAYCGSDSSNTVNASEIIFENDDAPSDLTYEKLAINRIKLEWNDNSEGEEGFRIDKKLDSEEWIEEFAIVEADSTNWIDESAEINQDINYRILAYYGEIESDKVETVVIDNTIPAPANLALEMIDEDVCLSWEFELAGIEGFKIEKKANGGEWDLCPDIISAETRKWEDVNFCCYDKYRIKAFYQGYESDCSDEVFYFEEIEGMVAVVGGSFEMGDHFNEGNDSELPVHTVTLNSFYIGQYEVTQGELETVMGIIPGHDYGEGTNYPVYYASWYGAVAYCNALSVQEGLTPCYDTSDCSCDFSVNGYRLPTEAEWEYAARGGIYWEDDLRYSGCYEESHLPDYAWYRFYPFNQSHIVGTKLPNQLGIYDMSGNVWEWCNDYWDEDYYETSPGDNPTGPDNSSYRVIRGGSWESSASSCRCARRTSRYPVFSEYDCGFRIARSLSR